jgi:anti-sigma B factor antagonist
MLRENLLRVQCEAADGVGLMRLEGELIAESRYEPERILREWLAADVCKVIIQCDKVTHIDSAGLSVLLGALHRYRRQDGDLILAQLNPALGAIFEVTSMERYFKIFTDVEAARSHFQQVAAAKVRAARSARGKSRTKR